MTLILAIILLSVITPLSPSHWPPMACWPAVISGPVPFEVATDVRE